MKNLKNKILEELSDTERGNNVLIDKNDKYNLYCGKHLFDRLNRHVNYTGNIGDKIKLSWIKDIVSKAHNIIENYCGNKIKVNDPNSCINLISSKHGTEKLNIVCFIRKVEIDGKLDIIIKTTKFGNKFYLTSNKDIEKIVENYNEIIIEL